MPLCDQWSGAHSAHGGLPTFASSCICHVVCTIISVIMFICMCIYIVRIVELRLKSCYSLVVGGKGSAHGGLAGLGGGCDWSSYSPTWMR